MKRVSDPCKRNLEVIKKKAKKAGSMLTLPTFYKKKSLQLTTNIAFLVKKYAAYIFK